jgi:hypothetical protein
MLLNQFGARSNRSAKKAVGTAENQDISQAKVRTFRKRKSGDSKGFSAGRECEGRDRFLGGLVVGRVAAVRATGAAFLGAGAERLVDDGLDGARTPAAFGAAAEATVNLFGIPRHVQGCTYGTTDIVVAQDVAGTDNHETARTLGDASSSIFKSATRCKRKNRNFKQFQTDAGEHWNESKRASLS